MGEPRQPATSPDHSAAALGESSQGESSPASSSIPSEPFAIGSHQVKVEGSIIHVRLIGPYLREHAREILLLADQLYDSHGEVALLADSSRSGPPPPETRRFVATWSYHGPYIAALYGANQVVRVMARLMIGAQRMLGSVQRIETQICDSEAQARAWIAEQRRKRKTG